MKRICSTAVAAVLIFSGTVAGGIGIVGLGDAGPPPVGLAHEAVELGDRRVLRRSVLARVLSRVHRDQGSVRSSAVPRLRCGTINEALISMALSASASASG